MFMSDQFAPSAGSIKIPIGGAIEKHRERYQQMLRNGKRFYHSVYTVTPGDRTLIHVKVPSETVEGLSYDAVFEFMYEPDTDDFYDCHVKVWSNCPSFVYSVAWVFLHWHPDGRPSSNKDRMMVDSMGRRVPKGSMMITELAPLLGQKPTHDKPVVRNPMGIPLFDKSLYYAIFYITDNLTMAAVKATHNNVTMKQVIASVARYDSLMLERKRLQNKMRDRKAREKSTNDAILRATERDMARTFSGGVKQPSRPKHAVRVTTPTAKSRTSQTMKTTAIKRK